MVQGFESIEDRLVFQPTMGQASEATVIVYLKTQDYLSLNEPVYVQLKTDDDSQRLAVYPSQYYQPIQNYYEFESRHYQNRSVFRNWGRHTECRSDGDHTKRGRISF